MSAVFLYNKSNTYGLVQDVSLLQTTLKQVLGNIRVADPLEPPTPCDFAIHFEVPYYGWMPWAKRNIMIMNPEWWEAAWNPYLEKMDALIFKCASDRDYFVQNQTTKAKTYVLPWTTSVPVSAFTKFPKSTKQSTGFLWLLGASKNKRAAAEKVLPLWKPEWPPIQISTTTPLTFDLANSKNITVNVRDLDASTIRQLQAYYPGHMIFSAAESLGMVALEGQAAGAFLIGNALPTYLEAFAGNPHVSLCSATLEPLKAGRQDTFASLESVLEGCVRDFLAAVLAVSRGEQAQKATQRLVDFVKQTQECMQEILKTPPTFEGKIPPMFKSAEECPPISVITLLHNRRKFVDLAFHNLLVTDYPKDKIEWVVIEDSDIMEEQASDKIIKFGTQCAPMRVSYIPLDKKNVPIGAMRNRAVKKALHDIILFMDDDDHYPPSSFSRRVSWLVNHPWKPSAVACTTIACYDLVHGTSAVNTPPWSLPLKQRISEATLVFKKSWWDVQRFPKVNMAEGEGLLEGRESDVLELPPQQMIVAMSHGKNASSRRIPAAGKPSCFWGFPKEFLVFLHKLAGIDIEEISS
jgi:hypothetical protein